MKILYVENNVVMSLVATMITFVMLFASFVLFEPVVGRAATDVFTVSQTITAEISFSTPATDVTMSPSIAGLTGGISNGSTDVVVTTNNSTGYNMTIQFSSSTAMYRNGGGGEIENYVATTVPDYNFDSTQIYGQFGYSVYSATDGGDIDPSFLDNGSACGSGTSNTAQCWLAPSSTAAETIVNRTSATPTGGATTTLQFRIDVPNNPNPVIPAGTYTATATLTAVTNP